MRLLLFIPALVYLALLVINLDIFKTTTEINFFWLMSFNIPVVIFVSIFFILYILLLWVGFNFSNLFTNMKTKKLEKEVFDLKSKLLNKQGDLIKNIESKFESQLTEFKKEADKKLELTKKETEKVVSNMSYDFKDIQDKLVKIAKQK
jgi:hypothetical protein